MLLDEARKILYETVDDLPIEEGEDLTANRIMEALKLIDNYVNADNIIDYVLEHCTLSQVVHRCKDAVIQAFGDDYTELTIRKESKK